jgi:hypothetical protein
MTTAHVPTPVWDQPFLASDAGKGARPRHPAGRSRTLRRISRAGLFSLALAFVCSGIAAEPLLLLTRTNEIPERGLVMNTVVCTEHQEFSLLPPTDWKRNVDTNEMQITWLSPDFNTLIRMRIVPGPDGRTPAPVSSELRKVIRQQFAGARIGEEFVCFTGGAAGLGFDLEQGEGDSLKTATRFASVPFPTGRVELSLSAPPESFSSQAHLFTSLLNSFQIAPRR